MHQPQLAESSRTRPKPKIAETRSARNDPTKITEPITQIKSCNSMLLYDGSTIAFLQEPKTTLRPFSAVPRFCNCILNTTRGAEHPQLNHSVMELTFIAYGV